MRGIPWTGGVRTNRGLWPPSSWSSVLNDNYRVFRKDSLVVSVPLVNCVVDWCLICIIVLMGNTLEEFIPRNRFREQLKEGSIYTFEIFMVAGRQEHAKQKAIRTGLNLLNAKSFYI